MPLKLIAPKPGRTPNYIIRGTLHGTYVERSTGTNSRKEALAALAKVKEDIERHRFDRPEEIRTFVGAATDYIKAGGEEIYLGRIMRWMGRKLLAEIDQAVIDRCAAELYPDAVAATRNRQVYSPISAVLKRAGIEREVKRPKGWRGTPRAHWLKWETEALPLVAAAMEINSRFGALCTFLLFCGTRISETLALRPMDIDLARAYARLRITKNGEAQGVHLPPVVVAALASLDLSGDKVFGYHRGGQLHKLLLKAEKKAGVTLPDGVAFHIFRHTYGAHMKSLGADLSRVGRWKDPASTRVYDHVQISEEARKADMLPTRTKSKR